MAGRRSRHPAIKIATALPLLSGMLVLGALNTAWSGYQGRFLAAGAGAVVVPVVVVLKGRMPAPVRNKGHASIPRRDIEVAGSIPVTSATLPVLATEANRQRCRLRGE